MYPNGRDSVVLSVPQHEVTSNELKWFVSDFMLEQLVIWIIISQDQDFAYCCGMFGYFKKLDLSNYAVES